MHDTCRTRSVHRRRGVRLGNGGYSGTGSWRCFLNQLGNMAMVILHQPVCQKLSHLPSPILILLNSNPTLKVSSLPSAHQSFSSTFRPSTQQQSHRVFSHAFRKSTGWESSSAPPPSSRSSWRSRSPVRNGRGTTAAPSPCLSFSASSSSLPLSSSTSPCSQRARRACFLPADFCGQNPRFCYILGLSAPLQISSCRFITFRCISNSCMGIPRSWLPCDYFHLYSFSSRLTSPLDTSSPKSGISAFSSHSYPHPPKQVNKC